MNDVEIIQQKGYNFLWINGCLWMWDIPVEQKVQKEIADKAFGDVLVAGYGLGIVQRFLTKNPNVKSILSTEKLKEVMDEVRKVYGDIYGRVQIMDFFDFSEDKKFDCVIGDGWKDIILEALEDYKRFKSKSEKILKPNGKILAWGGDFFEYLLKNETI